jgi:hypothetical protein
VFANSKKYFQDAVIIRFQDDSTQIKSETDITKYIDGLRQSDVQWKVFSLMQISPLSKYGIG